MDSQRTNAADFESITTKNISYFIGLDASSNRPNCLLIGDDNFTISGIPVKSGLLELSTNALVNWTSSRHVPYNIHFWTPESKRHAGNIMFVGGSTDSHIGAMWQTDDKVLFQAFIATGLATNRLAIP